MIIAHIPSLRYSASRSVSLECKWKATVKLKDKRSLYENKSIFAIIANSTASKRKILFVLLLRVICKYFYAKA